MAEVFSASYPAPTTPVKLPIVESTPVTQDDSPGPPIYTKADPANVPIVGDSIQEESDSDDSDNSSAAEDGGEVETNTSSFTGKKSPPKGHKSKNRNKKQPPPKSGSNGLILPFPIVEHPVYPKGEVLQDVRYHLECQKLFSKNIEQLICQFLDMRNELEITRQELGQAKRDYWAERDAKLNAQMECEDLKDTLRRTENLLGQTQLELIQARDDKKAAEDRLAAAIRELTKVVEELEKTKRELREALRERDDANRRADSFKNDVTFCQRRIERLQFELAAANKGEDAANQRESRLTEMLYQVELQKARIEKEKDLEQRKCRDQTDIALGHEKTVREQKTTIKELKREIKRLKEQSGYLKKTGVSTVSTSSNAASANIPTLATLRSHGAVRESETIETVGEPTLFDANSADANGDVPIQRAEAAAPAGEETAPAEEREPEPLMEAQA